MQRLIKEGKIKSVQWDDLHAVFLVVMGELNNDKSPLCLGFYSFTSGGQWFDHMVRQMGNGKLHY